MTAALSLSILELPASSGLQRSLPLRAIKGQNASSAVWDHYDRTTLIYDALHLPEHGIVRLYLPRLLNLSNILAEAQYRIDDNLHRPYRHHRYWRFETIEFKVDMDTPSKLMIENGKIGVLRATINRKDTNTFANRRVIYTMLRNERLEWIYDWLTFHQKVHGANAVLIADNGSTLYSPMDLYEMLRSVPGYEVQNVLSVPLPWGPKGHAQGADDGKYLQTAMLNLVRDRFLFAANSVLNMDVDELLFSRSGRSIFDRVQRLGFVTFPGEWRYTRQNNDNPRHIDHRYRKAQDKPCATKYCFRPQSFFGRMCLSVHGLERLNRRFFSDWKNFFFFHCMSISTSWKYDRTMIMDTSMKFDQTTAEVLDKILGAAKSV